MKLFSLLLLALTAFLSGCASMYPQSNLLLTKAPQVPSQAEITEAPFFAQTEYHCGPAALATILNHHDIAVSPEAIAPYVYAPGVKGSYQLELIAAARSYGLAVYPLESKLSTLIEEIASGNPILIMQNLGLPWSPVWHYAVVIGYDLNNQNFILRSGTEKRLLTRFTTFERTWTSANSWAVVIAPTDSTPKTALPHRWVKSLEDLQTMNHILETQVGYQAAKERWPDNLLVHLGMGNLLYEVKDYVGAKSAFASYVNLAPKNPIGWNNLAYSLGQLGCTNALKAITCASALNTKNQVDIGSTQKEVELLLKANNLSSGTAQNCTIPDCNLPSSIQ